MISSWQQTRATNDNRQNACQQVISNMLDQTTYLAFLCFVVNAAVSMKTLDAPGMDKSCVAIGSGDSGEGTALDGKGLPLTYYKDLIVAYRTKEHGALNQC